METRPVTIASPLNIGHGFTIERAEPAIFSVYQVLYSNADTELWYDWQMRLKDTLWTEDCFFVCQDGRKIGGAILTRNVILYPFLVSPFSDRLIFFQLLQRALLSRIQPGWTEIVGVDLLDPDVEILITLGFERTRQSRRVMIRPADRVTAILPAGFEVRVPRHEQAAEITWLLNQAYQGGLHAEVYGQSSEEDIAGLIAMFSKTATLDLSGLVYQSSTGNMVGTCLAGMYPDATNGFAAIAEVAVLPEYQGNGLGAFLINRVVSQALSYSQAVKLVVTSGNPAESLYLRLGFLPGPRFTRMRKAIP